MLVAENNRALLIDFGLACHVRLDSPEWVGRTVGTKKYRPPEMRESRAAQPSMDVYCFGQMADKMLRQRQRASSDASERGHSPSEDSWHERTTCRVLQEVAQQCNRRDPAERPTAWKLLQRLLRHCGEESERCDAPRVRVPLSSTPQPPPQPAAGGSEGSRARKRSRGSDEGSRSGSACRQRERERSP